jgi:ethanolamine permease
VSVGAFVVFGAINAMGVSLAATFELVVTALATFELGLFFVLTAPHVSPQTLSAQPLLPEGWGGVFAAVPFAIWFYLGLEGVGDERRGGGRPEEDHSPRLPRGHRDAGHARARHVLVCTSGVMPWRELVLDDSPLPARALARALATATR